jgi:hypothetical protein
VLVLQSCTDPLYIPPHKSNETFPTTSDCTYGVGNIKYDDDADVEESFIAATKVTDVGITQEESCGDLAFPNINTELNEVSYVCVYVCY